MLLEPQAEIWFQLWAVCVDLFCLGNSFFSILQGWFKYYKARVYHGGSHWKNTNENYQNISTVKEKAFFAFFILYYYLLDIGLQYQFTKLVTLTGLLLCATHCTN